MNFISKLLVISMRVMSYVPMPILYFFSDVIYLLNFYIFKYRKRITLNNLRNSFPEKSEKEIQKIAKQFYRHLTDLIFETVKLSNISQKELLKRVEYVNPELLDKYKAKGQHLIVFASHSGNWEWAVGAPLVLPFEVLAVYRKLSDPIVENLVTSSRARFGCIPVEMHHTIREVLHFRKENKQAITWLASDQSPVKSDCWTTFLNQETGFYTGGERIARKLGQPVLYQHMRKVKRGHYEIEFIPICDNPAETKEYEITLRYARMLEERIHQQPAYYIWSHKRWKRKRPENEPIRKSSLPPLKTERIVGENILYMN